jgi:organic radical activating enzyme
VVLTGGEPFRQQTGKLVEQISLQGHHVQIESNGMLEPDSLTIEMLRYGYASLIVSPKTGRIHDTCRGFAMAFKYVLDHRSVDPMDGLPIEALGHKAPARGVARPREGVPVYVNPFDSGDPLENELNLLAAANSALKYGYIVGVQLHKLIGLA